MGDVEQGREPAMASSDGGERGGGMPWRVAKAVGDYGERLACAHLREAGYEVLDRNWRCRQGELDIIARHGEVLVFCEVKTRRSGRFGSPAEAVTWRKAARLRVLAGAWVREHQVRAASMQIDVIGVELGQGSARVQHLQGVA